MTLRLPDNVRERGYKAVDRLGGHELADTYLAEREGDDEPVVLKLLDVSQIETWKDLELFERQRKTLSKLDHPAIPRQVDSFRYDGDQGPVCCIVSEYVEGTALDELIEEGEGWNEEEVVGFLDQMLALLEYLHGFTPPVVHRDIKPTNIVRTDDGRYVLIDFGAVQTVLAGDVGGTTFVGTNGYMPPEQMMGRATAASDVYALAATAVELLSGIAPRLMSKGGVKLEFSEHVDASEQLEELLEAMLLPDAQQRLGDASRLRRALDSGQLDDMCDDSTTRQKTSFASPLLDMKADDGAVTIRRVSNAFVVSPVYGALLLLGGAWLLGLVSFVNAADATVSSLAAGFGVMTYLWLLGVSIWGVLDRSARRRMGQVIKISRLPTAMTAALLIPFVVGPVILWARHQEAKFDHVAERLRLDGNGVKWEKIGTHGGVEETLEVPADEVQSVEVDAAGRVVLDTADEQRVVFDGAMGTGADRQVLAHRLRAQLGIETESE